MVTFGCAAKCSPSPWGEGWGEGTGRIQLHRYGLVQHRHAMQDNQGLDAAAGSFEAGTSFELTRRVPPTTESAPSRSN